MPLRISCHRAHHRPAHVLHPYWGTAGLPRPLVDLYVLGPSGQSVLTRVQVDTAADFSLLSSRVAAVLGLRLPFPRQVPFTGAGGTQSFTSSFPPDGAVSLFVTDFREYAYLPQPLVGFHDPRANPSGQRSVLGLTGFLQHFRLVLDLPGSPPAFELHPTATFPGAVGVLPRDRTLTNFLAQLRARD